MTQTPREVIEETISQASTFFVAQTEGGYGVILNPIDLKELINELDTTVTREQKLKEAVEKVSEIYESEYTDEEAVNAINDMFIDLLSTLYPDTPAQPAASTPEITARPIDDWHEDYGDVIWWTFPIQESPYCGSPLDSDWPDYHTHWTPLVIPAAPKEGDTLD
jgi:hypothetical protein